MLCICVVFQQIDSMYLGKGTRLVVHPSIHSFIHPSMNNTYVHTVQVSAHSVAIELQLQPDTFSTNHRFPGVLQLGSWTPRHVRLLCCFGDRVIIFRSLLIFLLSFLLTYSVEGLTHEFVSVSYILLMEKIPLCAIKRPLSGLQNFLQQFVICMPTRVLDLNSVFSTVGHGCLSIGTTSWRLQIRVWIIWSTLKQLSQVDFAKQIQLSGYFQFSPRRAYDSFFDNFVFSDDDWSVCRFCAPHCSASPIRGWIGKSPKFATDLHLQLAKKKHII